MQNLFKIGSKRCSACEELENRLLATQADNEYLRTVALRNEYTCAICEGVGGQQQQHQHHYHQHNQINTLSGVSSTTSTTADASKRLIELNQRHKHQLQDISRDRSRWQQDTQVRLSKYATISKSLNEEAAERKQQAVNLQDKLETVTAERDAMATELSQLRAAARQHKEQQKELEQLRSLMSAYQHEGLQAANEAIEKRNGVIVDLATKLNTAMDALAVSQQQQQLNRRINATASGEDDTLFWKQRCQAMEKELDRMRRR
eukprot:CAMPEP_0202463588 /NCGR_PEP_ID=MMETSP1360-20130828/58756_1 /ASSEMBLY_ACC=CAM_ASM_000848 /TAXON_ID=515479 /ORGANISM="Licmophora paradoxa, Strain CCMP2313" /LENGTH=260 /DNA_ID=CAMNT_0049086551 /DNA_START=116 /DNA_END=898 /DNA_ORIENTATION=-